MPVQRSRSEKIIPSKKPLQRKTIALPFEDPQDALVLPYVLSQIYSSTEDEDNALGLSGLEKPSTDATKPTDDVDIGTLVTGVATMMPTSVVQAATQTISPTAQGHSRSARSLSPIAFSSTSSRYLGRTGNNLLGHLLGAISPPLSPTHGGPITTVNFG